MADGKVGIGIVAPEQLLHLKGAVPSILFTHATNGYLGFIGDATDFLPTGGTAADTFGLRSEGAMTFGTNGNNFRAIIATDGNVGIGTTDPKEKVHIWGAGTQVLAIQGDSGTGPKFTIRGGGTLTFSNDTTPYMNLNASGRFTLNTYGSGTHTGTAAYRLSVTSGGIVIETPIGAGAVDGAGTADYIAKWTDGDTIGDSIIVDTGSKVGIGTLTPTGVGSRLLHIYGSSTTSAELKVQANYSAGLYIENGDGRARFYSSHGSNSSYGGYIFEIGSASAKSGTEIVRFWADGDAQFTSTANRNNYHYINTATAGYNPILGFVEAGTRRAYINYVSADNYLSVTTEEGSSNIAIMAAGKVGVGTTNPENAFEVKKSVTGSWVSRIYNTATTGNPYGLLVRVDKAAAADTHFGVYNGAAHTFAVKGDGNVGIGIDAPQQLLHLKSNDPKIYLEDGNAGTNEKVYAIYPAGSQYVLQTLTDAYGAGENVFIVDRTGTTVDKTTFSNGDLIINDNVGIGTAAPGSLLQLKSDGTLMGGSMTVMDSGENQPRFYAGLDGNEHGYLSLVQSNGTTGGLYLTGNSAGTNWILGKVGIGTAVPATTLDVNGITTFRDYLKIGAAGVHGVITWGGGLANTVNFIGASGKNLSLGTDGAYDKLVITTGGLVGIGTTAPSAALDVVTSSTVWAAEINQTNTSNGDGLYVNTGSTASADYVASFRANNVNVLAVKANGLVGIGSATPAATLEVVGLALASGQAASKGIVKINGNAVGGAIHYDTYATLTSYNVENRFQLIAQDVGSDAGFFTLTSTPATGTGANKHWIMGHRGPDMSNEFQIGYKTSTASGNVSTTTLAQARLRIETSGRVIVSDAGGVANGVFGEYTKLVVDTTESHAQLLATDTGSWGASFIMTNAPASGNNRHWWFHHCPATHGTTANSLIIRYAATNTATNIGGDGTGTTPVEFKTDGTVLFNAGNVSIGTTTNASTLTLNGNQSCLALSRNIGTDPVWYISSDALHMYMGTNQALSFMSLQTDGNVGIGVNSPTCILDVRDSGDANTKQHLINTAQTTAGRETEFIFGKDNGANLSATLKYYYHTTQASRRIDLLHYGTNAGLTILNNGSIGFNDTAPDRMLTLKGGTVNGATRYPAIHGRHGSNTLFIMEQWYGNEGFLGLYKDNVRTVQFRGGEQTAPSYIDNGNNFGLGTKTPGAKLEVITTSTTAPAGYFYINTVHTGYDSNSAVSIFSDHVSATGQVLRVRGDGSGNLLTLNQGGTDRLVVQADGNVGIGTTAPSCKIHAESTGADKCEILATEAAGAFKAVLGVQNSPGVAQQAYVGSLSNTSFKILTNGVSRVVIASGGAATFSGTVNAAYVISTGYAQASSLRIPSTTNYHEIWNSGDELRIYRNQSAAIKIGASNLATFGGDVTVPSHSVGIGITNPSSLLQLKSGGALMSGSITVVDSGGNQPRFYAGLDGNEHGYLSLLQNNGTTGGLYLTGNSAGTNWVLGKLGIGRTAPSTKLVVNGTFDASATPSVSAPSANTANKGILITREAASGWGTGHTYGIDFGAANSIDAASQYKVAAIYGAVESVPYYLAGKLGFYTTDGTNGALLEERMTIKGNGKVGIGTTNPTARLYVVETANNAWALQVKGTGTSANYGLEVDCSAGYTLSSQPFRVTTPSGGPFYVNGLGSVGIGDGSPTYKLDVNGTGRFTGALTGATAAFSGEVDLTVGLDWHDPTSSVYGRLGYGSGFVYVGALGATGILQLMSGGSTACTFAANHDATFTGAMTVGGALLPAANGTYNLGSSGAYWKNCYFEDTAINGTLYVGGVLTAASNVDVAQSKYLRVGGSTSTAPFSARQVSGSSMVHVMELNTGTSVQAWSFGLDTVGNYVDFVIQSEYGAGSWGERFRITKQYGCVGIGTTNPGQKLHVNGNILVNAQILTPGGSNLALNPNTGLVTVGGALQASGTGLSSFAGPLTVAGALTQTAGVIVLNDGAVNNANQYLQYQSFSNDNAFVVNGDAQGRVAIGAAVSSLTTCYIGNTHTHRWTGGTGRGMWIDPGHEPTVSQWNYGEVLQVRGSIKEGADPGSGWRTHPWFRGTNFVQPVITAGTATVDNSATVYINGAMSCATANYAFYINSGQSYFGGSIGIGTTSPGDLLHIYGTRPTIRLQGGSGLWMMRSDDNQSHRLEILDANGGYDKFAIYPGNTGAIVLHSDGAGCVGIGTAANLEKLTTYSATSVTTGPTTAIKCLGTHAVVGGGTGIFLKSTTSHASDRYGAQIGVIRRAEDNGSCDLLFKLENTAANALTERMRILGDGNVGIGTTNPGTTLEVNGRTMVGISPNDNNGNSDFSVGVGGSGSTIALYTGHIFMGGVDTMNWYFKLSYSGGSSRLYSWANDIYISAGWNGTSASHDVVLSAATSNNTPAEYLRCDGSTGKVYFSKPAYFGTAVYDKNNSYGTSGQVLSTTGSGGVDWVTPSGGGGDTVSITTSADDILSVSSGAISGVDAGSYDRIVFWDNGSSKLTYLAASTGLSISGTSLSVSSSVCMSIRTSYNNTTSTPNSKQFTFSSEGSVYAIADGYNTVKFSSYTSSDYRLKKNISTFNSEAWTKVKSVNLRKFDFDESAIDESALINKDIVKPSTLTDKIGWIAHELSEAGIEGAVTGSKDEVDGDGNAVYQRIDPIKLIPVMWGALNEAITKIETLETKVQTLENN